jgi:hypothetical protein
MTSKLMREEADEVVFLSGFGTRSLISRDSDLLPRPQYTNIHRAIGVALGHHRAVILLVILHGIVDGFMSCSWSWFDMCVWVWAHVCPCFSGQR